MSTPLLATKLSTQSNGKYQVDRPYLVAKLDECLNPVCWLALISAPVGYGKTTLQTQQEGIEKQSLDLLWGAIPPGLESSLALLINELDQLFNPFVLILNLTIVENYLETMCALKWAEG
jgi:hypothetical protein